MFLRFQTLRMSGEVLDEDKQCDIELRPLNDVKHDKPISVYKPVDDVITAYTDKESNVSQKYKPNGIFSPSDNSKTGDKSSKEDEKTRIADSSRDCSDINPEGVALGGSHDYFILENVNSEENCLQHEDAQRNSNEYFRLEVVARESVCTKL